MRLFALFLACLAWATAGRAADYYPATPDSVGVRVDFAPRDLAGMDSGTMTVVGATGSGTFVLKGFKQVCAPSCAGAGVSCFARGAYSGRLAASADLFAFPGKAEASDVQAVAMSTSSKSVAAVVKAWSEFDSQNGISLSQWGAAGVDAGVWGRWRWDAGHGQATFESGGEGGSVTVSSDAVKDCLVLEGGDFESLNCPGAQGDNAKMFGWLYYKDRFMAQYVCDDCALPDLRASSTFKLDGNALFVVRSGKHAWLLQDTESGFKPLKAPSELVSGCR